jgi:iduronate 2-sulfatase
MRLQEQYKDLPVTTSKHAPVGMPPEAFASCDFLQDHDDVKAAVMVGQGILPNTSLPDVLARKIRAGYAAGITWMDEQAGKVLDTLEKVGHKDDTIVLFTADHGWGLGEHGMWCKYTNFENQVRVPMLVRVPWIEAAIGKHSSALIELVDIFPTLASLANIKPADALEGYDFSTVLQAGGLKPADWRTAAFSQYPRCQNSTLANEPPYTANRDVCAGHPADEFTHMGLTVRTDDYRYTEWRLWDGHICEPKWSTPPSGRELYSHVGDIRPACFDCFENENIVDKEPAIASHHAEMLKAQFQHATDFHSGCPHPPKLRGSDDREVARQIYAEGGEKIPAELVW